MEPEKIDCQNLPINFFWLRNSSKIPGAVEWNFHFFRNAFFLRFLKNFDESNFKGLPYRFWKFGKVYNKQWLNVRYQWCFASISLKNVHYGICSENLWIAVCPKFIQKLGAFWITYGFILVPVKNYLPFFRGHKKWSKYGARKNRLPEPSHKLFLIKELI